MGTVFDKPKPQRMRRIGVWGLRTTGSQFNNKVKLCCGAVCAERNYEMIDNFAEFRFSNCCSNRAGLAV